MLRKLMEGWVVDEVLEKSSVDGVIREWAVTAANSTTAVADDMSFQNIILFVNWNLC